MSGSTSRLIAIAGLGLAVAACADLTSDASNTLALSAAMQTVPAGFSANTNSFDASGDDGLPFFPGSMNAVEGLHNGGGNSGPGGEHPNGGDGGDHHDGFGGGLRGLLMGGGLGPDFIGAFDFGRGRGHGPFRSFTLPSTCTFDSGNGVVTCPDHTERGFTVKSAYAFKSDAGVAQATFDTLTTNSVNVKIDVRGTKIRSDGSVKAIVQHSSDRTVEGLAPGKTERKVNGTAKAHEEVNGTRDDVRFAAVRDANDTTTNLVVPIADGHPTIPRSGKVIRNMTVTITPEGGTATTRSRREEITFDGTNVISVKITQDATTKNCTISLPARKLVCE